MREKVGVIVLIWNVIDHKAKSISHKENHRTTVFIVKSTTYDFVRLANF